MEGIRPIFVYGTLMAAPLLSWVLLGDSSKLDEILARRKPGRITGFTRHSVLHSDYPALVLSTKSESISTVDGFVVFPRDASEWKKLDAFEGDAYIRTSVIVDVGGGHGVEADTYVWGGERSLLGGEDWNFEWFESQRLEDWLDIFCGMELVG